MSVTKLAGVAWAHRRCWGPLEHTAETPGFADGIEVRWKRRTLFSFGEGDLEDFTATNDLIIFDHPFTGDVASRGLMMDLGRFLTAEDIKMLESNQLGASYRSYSHKGGVYALPIDAAATTAAWRPDLMKKLDAKPPRHIRDVYELSSRARENNQWVAWAAKPTDLFCTYIAMLASLGVNVGHEDGPFCPQEQSAHVIQEMKRLRDVIYPGSFEWNPINLFDFMTSSDQVVYAPFAFNYVNYCTLPSRSLRFGASPRMLDHYPARGILGGAGIGVSASSQNPRAAFQYAMKLINPSYQASTYVAHGGQPGMRSAWISEDCDEMTNGFFSGCLEAMENAFLRPNIPGFITFFHEGTHKLASVVIHDSCHDEFWCWLTKFYDSLREGVKAAGPNG